MKPVFIVITFIIFIGKNGEHKQHDYIRVSDQIKIHIPDKDEFLYHFSFQTPNSHITISNIM